MKVVVVDGHTLNPGDLSWDEIKKLAECGIYDQTGPKETIERCKDADMVVTNKVVFDKNTIELLPKLKFISVTATGYNVIDVKAAKGSGIIVSNVPTYGTKSVAQMVFALLLELSHHVGYHAETVKKGRWSACDHFCYWDRPLIELAGLTMGIVGFGRIGRLTADLAEAFGMNVIVYDPYADKASHPNTEFIELEELYSRSDVISLHCPLTDTNREMINSKSLNLMKPGAFIINTSRGLLINETDLAEALNSKKIAGAGLDVLSTEPPTNDNPLLTAQNCIITPHIAWATKSARERLMSVTVANIKAFIGGSAINVVS
jgi:glycerate dehydrogenase